MVRWWDYVAAILAADLITIFIMAGFTAQVWYVPIIAGLCAGLGINLWTDFYCQWRLHYERKSNGEQ